jgi:hypothetical protein
MPFVQIYYNPSHSMWKEARGIVALAVRQAGAELFTSSEHPLTEESFTVISSIVLPTDDLGRDIYAVYHLDATPARVDGDKPDHNAEAISARIASRLRILSPELLSGTTVGALLLHSQVGWGTAQV